jgi:hypothetical protein
MPHPAIVRSDSAHDDRVRQAIDRLKSLHDPDGGLVDVVTLGAVAIPALSEVLFAREPSGLFQVRCRAVEALAALKAFSTIAQFLRMHREIADPVERLGDDAVVSAAARAMARLREPWVYELLAELARRRPLQGVLAGLGSFFRAEFVPIFIGALQEDELRLTAEAILRGFGSKARTALLAAAREPGEDARSESDSHLRKRRSAIALLADIGVSRRDWSRLRPLVDDADHQIALLACELGLKVGSKTDQAHIASRLQAIWPAACWIHRERIDQLMESLYPSEQEQRSHAVTNLHEVPLPRFPCFR